jgi:hypothetical protein
MTEKTSTPEDSIHNLRIVIEALQNEGLPDHASLVEDGISQIERMRTALQIVAMMIKGEMIEAAIVDMSMRSLGDVVNSALSPITSTDSETAK